MGVRNSPPAVRSREIPEPPGLKAADRGCQEVQKSDRLPDPAAATRHRCRRQPRGRDAVELSGDARRSPPPARAHPRRPRPRASRRFPDRRRGLPETGPLLRHRQDAALTATNRPALVGVILSASIPPADGGPSLGRPRLFACRTKCRSLAACRRADRKPPCVRPWHHRPPPSNPPPRNHPPAITPPPPTGAVKKPETAELRGCWRVGVRPRSVTVFVRFVFFVVVSSACNSSCRRPRSRGWRRRRVLRLDFPRIKLADPPRDGPAVRQDAGYRPTKTGHRFERHQLLGHVGNGVRGHETGQFAPAQSGPGTVGTPDRGRGWA